MEIQIVEWEKLVSQTIYLLNSNCGDASISKTVLRYTAPVDLFMKEVANTGYWNDSRLYMHIMKFLGTHTHSNGRVTLDWQFQIGKCGQIREKLRKIRLLERYTGAVLSVICYSCREESVTRLVRNHIKPVTEFPNREIRCFIVTSFIN